MFKMDPLKISKPLHTNEDLGNKTGKPKTACAFPLDEVDEERNDSES